MKKDCHAGSFAPRSTSAVLATADEAESKAVTCARAKPCVHLASGSPEGNTTSNSPIASARRRSRLSLPPTRARAARGLLTGRASCFEEHRRAKKCRELQAADFLAHLHSVACRGLNYRLRRPILPGGVSEPGGGFRIVPYAARATRARRRDLRPGARRILRWSG